MGGTDVSKSGTKLEHKVLFSFHGLFMRVQNFVKVYTAIQLVRLNSYMLYIDTET